jgi:predicted phage terminase large subunit-like protein
LADGPLATGNTVKMGGIDDPLTAPLRLLADCNLTRAMSVRTSPAARGRWSILERERIIKLCAAHDRSRSTPGSYTVYVEREPGSAGKESAEATLRMLHEYTAFPDRVTGSKETRAEPFAGQVQAGNVYLIAGPWHRAFLDELESFPHGKYKDQVDAAAGAFTRLIHGPGYDYSYSGFQ